MSAKPSPSMLPLPPNSSTDAALRGSSVLPIHSGRGRPEPDTCYASVVLPYSRREPATVTERAFHPAQWQSIRNSRFRFEVPARIVRQGGECRRRRCDPTGCDFSAPNAKPGAHNPCCPSAAFPQNHRRKPDFGSFLRITQFFSTSKRARSEPGELQQRIHRRSFQPTPGQFIGRNLVPATRIFCSISETCSGLRKRVFCWRRRGGTIARWHHDTGVSAECVWRSRRSR